MYEGEWKNDKAGFASGPHPAQFLQDCLHNCFGMHFILARHMARVCTTMQMAPNMMGSGKKISSTDKAGAILTAE